MIDFKLSRILVPNSKIMLLGAHSDDIEIGCGGTVLKLADACPDLDVTWIVFSAIGPRYREAERSAELFLKCVKNKKIVIKKYRDGFFPYDGAMIKGYFEEIKKSVSPDLIFTHHRHDLHQDHRLISELTWNTFRNNLVLEYEIHKYDGDLRSPNIFMPLSEEYCQKKIEHIISVFKSQENKSWFGEEAFKAIMRLRSVEANSVTAYAEAFYCRKLVLGF